MFSEFLLPDLVLFGEFLNNKTQCQHAFHWQDGQLIINQSIHRTLTKDYPHTITKLSNIAQMQQKQEQNQQFINHQQLNADDQQNPHLKQIFQKNESEDNEDGQNDQPFQGYFQEDINPYGQQYYGFGMDNEYLPEQLNNLLGTSQTKINKATQNIPFFKNSEQNQLSKKDEKPHQKMEESDEQSWLTEEEQEDYLINGQLEEAGGNFAIQLGED